MTAEPRPSAFAPFRHRAFAVLWTATLVANTGTWFRDVANGWLMTDLAPSPTMVALVQAATTLPVFLLSLPAGALADLLDRRWLLVGTQVFMGFVGITLALSVTFELITPWLLLVLVFAAGIGTALMGPAWQSIVPELVPRPVLRPAVALNSLGINIARAIGPAAGGLIVAGAGVALAYWLDAASYILITLALLLWKRPQPASTLPPERFAPAMATGVRYILANTGIQRTLLRAAAFFIFGSAYWALLPLIARQTLAGDASLYGALLTSIGAGAVTGAFVLPRLSRVFSANTLILAGTLLTATAMAAIPLVPDPLTAMAGLFVAGAAWITILTTLNVTAQTLLPDWVRARGLAIYITVFFGSMTFGSLLWGRMAEFTSISAAMLLAAAGSALTGLLAALVRLPDGEPDLTPSMHWPEPALQGEIAGERGPVAIEIRYRVRAHNRAAFLATLRELSAERRRDGGYGWQVYEDTENAEIFIELFFAPSWLDHLRQHSRVTNEDADVQARVRAFHEDTSPPRVRHWVAAHPGDASPPAVLREAADRP
jgi:MFS family permease